MALVPNIDTANQAVNTPGHAISLATWQRPDEANAYAALDIITDDADVAQVLEFPNTGRSGAILRAIITIGETDTITPRLWIFDSEPTNLKDNGALALVEADMPKIVGRFDFVDADKLLVGTLLNVYFPSGDTTAGNEVAIKMPYTTATGSLYGLLQTVPGYTPASGGVKFTIRLQLERD